MAKTKDDGITRLFLMTLAAATLLPLLLSATAASAAAREQLLGRWCGEITDYNFSKSALRVVFHDHRKDRIWRITAINNLKGQPGFEVVWDVRDTPNNSTYFRFEENNRLLVQLPNVDKSGKPIGDKGPRRDFHRC